MVCEWRLGPRSKQGLLLQALRILLCRGSGPMVPPCMQAAAEVLQGLPLEEVARPHRMWSMKTCSRVWSMVQSLHPTDIRFPEMFAAFCSCTIRCLDRDAQPNPPLRLWYTLISIVGRSNRPVWFTGVAVASVPNSSFQGCGWCPSTTWR